MRYTSTTSSSSSHTKTISNNNTNNTNSNNNRNSPLATKSKNRSTIYKITKDNTTTVLNVQQDITESIEFTKRLTNAVNALQVEEAEKIFKQMEAKGLLENTQNNNYSLIPFNNMIKLYSNATKDSHKTREIFNLLKSKGLSPNTMTYTLLLQHFARIGDIDSLTRYLQQMQTDAASTTSSIQWDDLIFKIVINAYGKKAKLKEMKEFYQTMLQKRIAPDVFVYNSMITSYARNENTKAMIECYQEMLTNGIRPNSTTHVVIMKALAKHQQFDHLLDYIQTNNNTNTTNNNSNKNNNNNNSNTQQQQQILPLESTQLTIRTKCTATSENITKLKEYLAQMKKDGFDIDDITFSVKPRPQ